MLMPCLTACTILGLDHNGIVARIEVLVVMTLAAVYEQIDMDSDSAAKEDKQKKQNLQNLWDYPKLSDKKHQTQIIRPTLGGVRQRNQMTHRTAWG